MDRYLRHHEMDLSRFEANTGAPEARYGLPGNISFCTRCVISNQRPNSAPSEFGLEAESNKTTIKIDDAGVCDACKVWEDKHETIDWAERKRELQELCDRYRRNDGRYDCIVPGSGGKDSFVQAHVLKYEFGMNPLTITWAPHIYTDWGWSNFQAWIHAGFDNHLVTPNGLVHRLLTRLSTENMLHPFQPFVFGQRILPVRFSIDYDIPLIFYGDHAAEYGTPKEDAEEPTVDPMHYCMPGDEDDILLGGVSFHDLKKHFGLSSNDLSVYMPIKYEDLKDKTISFHHLGYYLPWHPQSNYYYAVDHGKFQPSPERTPGTYSKYAGIDDKIDDFNFYCYFIKFGIGRATYDAAQETRSRDIARDEGVALVKRYDGEFPERFADEIFQYVSLPEDQFPVASKNFEQPIMDRDYFMDLCDRFRSPHLWKFETGAWALRHTVWTEG